MADVRFNRQRLIEAAHAGAVNGLNASMIVLQREIGKQLNKRASNRTSGKGPSPAGEPPAKMTGTLARSWQAVEAVDRSKLGDRIRPRIRVGSNIKYARIHEYGGTIRGKPWLTIPISKQAVRASQTGIGAKSAFPDAFVIKGGGKSLRVVERQGGKLITHYVLKRSVKLPARPYVRPAMKVASKSIHGVVNDQVRLALRRATA